MEDDGFQSFKINLFWPGQNSTSLTYGTHEPNSPIQISIQIPLESERVLTMLVPQMIESQSIPIQK